MIAIVDYGMGNLGSIQNMLAMVGAQSVITRDVELIRASDKLILPGVGAFDNAMRNLDDFGLIPLLNDKVLNQKVPVLCICLGMQLLTRKSEEGVLPGLGWIDADTIRFKFNGEASVLKIPHMGWNTIEIKKKSFVMDNMYENPRFYFVHSYHVRCNDESAILATSSYGITFHAAVIKENIVGTQFHPEKSHKFGMKLLRNFVEGIP